MDAERKRQLKALGKAEVERQSAELQATLSAANPAPIGSDEWAKNYKTGTLREKWVRETLPILRKKKLDKLFVVLPVTGAGVTEAVDLFVQCRHCSSVGPSLPPKRFFYWGSCDCGNVKWRCFWRWRKRIVQQPFSLDPVKLIGKG
jgi:hypothetical protein